MALHLPRSKAWRNSVSRQTSVLAPLRRSSFGIRSTNGNPSNSRRSPSTVLGGDPSKLSLQMALQKPGPNIRGLQSAFIGADAVTIIPDRAVAELDIRLVKETNGQQMLELLREHVRRLGYHLVDADPDDATQAAHTRIAKLISTRRMASAPFRTPAPLPEARHVTEALERRLGEAPIRIRSLGTVPASRFIKELGIPAMVVPIVNFDNNQHALNENIRLGNLFRGVVIRL
jgi:acetylornithine deacetylase/succinyl-diaminopimelate desuccinylase-like protein